MLMPAVPAPAMIEAPAWIRPETGTEAPRSLWRAASKKSVGESKVWAEAVTRSWSAIVSRMPSFVLTIGFEPFVAQSPPLQPV